MVGDGAAVRLAPNPAFAGARISVILGESGIDPSKCSFEWRRNGFVVDGASRSELEPSMFAKGDSISVLVSVPATAGGRARTLRGEARVANSPPRIGSVGIAMVVAASGPELQAKVDCVDPDGETPGLTYEWFLNGAPVEGVRSGSLSATGLARGDHVTVAVVARDDESVSPPMGSEVFVLENHPPAFSSVPAAPRPRDATFQYRAVVVDPDGDPLRYELLHAPDGMTIGPQGEVRWELPSGDRRRGDFAVRIRAADSNGGEAVQSFTIQLGAAPPPR
jgi:hypothetical protein